MMSYLKLRMFRLVHVRESSHVLLLLIVHKLGQFASKTGSMCLGIPGTLIV